MNSTQGHQVFFLPLFAKTSLMTVEDSLANSSLMTRVLGATVGKRLTQNINVGCRTDYETSHQKIQKDVIHHFLITNISSPLVSWFSRARCSYSIPAFGILEAQCVIKY